MTRISYAPGACADSHGHSGRGVLIFEGYICIEHNLILYSTVVP